MRGIVNHQLKLVANGKSRLKSAPASPWEATEPVVSVGTNRGRFTKLDFGLKGQVFNGPDSAETSAVRLECSHASFIFLGLARRGCAAALLSLGLRSIFSTVRTVGACFADSSREMVEKWLKAREKMAEVHGNRTHLPRRH